ncbi:unnamed protein product, partial [Onchocerca flexuosa]|uniref:UAP56-interacting factor n=1 Tax=Onchocerca flexuosa TaxID=387005 RepID=A0A183HMK0_9BILA
FFRSQQPDPQIQQQFHQIALLRQLKQKQSSPINKKFRPNIAVVTGQDPQRNIKLTRLDGRVNSTRKKTNLRKNGQLIVISDSFIVSKKSQSNSLRSKSQLPQFVRLRKLLGLTASEKMRKNSNRKDGQFRSQNFRSG